MLLTGLLTSCSSQSTADGPHATVLMRDGTQIAGIVTASTPSGITLMGDDKASHTMSMAQVKSVSYDQPQPVQSGATQPPTAADSGSAPPDATHDDHYHPPVSAIQSKTYALPAGALIPVRSEETIDAAVATGGQTYAAEVTRDIKDADGAVVIPRGSNAQIIIRSAAKGGRIKGASDLVLDLDSVSVEGRLYTLDTQDMIQERPRRRRREPAHGYVHWRRSGGRSDHRRHRRRRQGAAIGAASGAGAGAGTQIVTKGAAIRIPAETILTFRLDAPLRVDAAN